MIKSLWATLLLIVCIYDVVWRTVRLEWVVTIYSLFMRNWFNTLYRIFFIVPWLDLLLAMVERPVHQICGDKYFTCNKKRLFEQDMSIVFT